MALKSWWGQDCADAVASMEKDLEALLVHYDFPEEHWDALRTTNPIGAGQQGVQTSLEAYGDDRCPEGLKALLAFTAMRLEYGWLTTPITSGKLKNLTSGKRAKVKAKLEIVEQQLLQ